MPAFVGPMHFRGTYHLPSWQGGDREMRRCAYSMAGWVPKPGRLTSDRKAVTCRDCRRLLRADDVTSQPHEAT
jgi:hypothetical protein